jgi:hypothetical protein
MGVVRLDGGVEHRAAALGQRVGPGIFVHAGKNEQFIPKGFASGPHHAPLAGHRPSRIMMGSPPGAPPAACPNLNCANISCSALPVAL